MIDWGYLAGFFDGEGSLHKDHLKSSVQLRIDNTCEEAVEKIQEFLGFGSIVNRGRAKPHHKDRYRLTVAHHAKVLGMLRNMLPYLIVKKEAAEIMIGYIEGRKWNAYHGRKSRQRTILDRR